MPIPRLASALVLTLALAGGPALAQAPADSPRNVAEPTGLWTGPMRGYTPTTLAGAKVIDAGELAKLAASENPLLLDFGPADRKPPSMAPDAPWMPAHRSIPGAIWMPGAGLGSADPAFARAFAVRVAALAGGDLSRPVVTFCHPECWGSWNAGKRLVALGYRRVYWFPEGVEGWQAERDVATVKADPVWALAAPADQPQ